MIETPFELKLSLEKIHKRMRDFLLRCENDAMIEEFDLLVHENLLFNDLGFKLREYPDLDKTIVTTVQELIHINSSRITSVYDRHKQDQEAG